MSALAKLSTFLGRVEFSTADPMQLIWSLESESRTRKSSWSYGNLFMSFNRNWTKHWDNSRCWNSPQAWDTTQGEWTAVIDVLHPWLVLLPALAGQHGAHITEPCPTGCLGVVMVNYGGCPSSGSINEDKQDVHTPALAQCTFYGCLAARRAGPGSSCDTPHCAAHREISSMGRPPKLIPNCRDSINHRRQCRGRRGSQPRSGINHRTRHLAGHLALLPRQPPLQPGFCLCGGAASSSHPARAC